MVSYVHECLADALRTLMMPKRCKHQVLTRLCSKVITQFLTVVRKNGYTGEFEITDDHRAGKIVLNLIGRLHRCGAISSRFDVCNSQDLEQWQNNLLPSHQRGFIVLTASAGIMDQKEARRRCMRAKILACFFQEYNTYLPIKCLSEGLRGH